MIVPGHSSSSKTPLDRTWLVAIAASLWGLDGLLREPLAVTINPATVVLWEHVIIVVILSPFVLPAMRVFARCSVRDKAAIVTIGVGASAVGTALFTQAFRLSAQTGDFITPLILQKLQPIFAVLLAVVLLRERLKPGFAVYAVPALVGAWLMAFAQPFDVKIAALQSALFAVGAAILWASGTVLGRMVTANVSPRDMTVLRFSFGVIGAIAVVAIVQAPVLPGWSNMPGLVLLAIIPGLLGLGLYYLGLRYTAASRATFAEMAFPATAAIVGVLFLGTTLTWSQWVGFAIVVAAITALGWRERTKPTVDDPLLQKVL